MALNASFLFLLLSLFVSLVLPLQVIARETHETQGVSPFNDAKLPCKRCDNHCCSVAELAKLKGRGAEFMDGKHHGAGCHHFCGSYCCSPAEFAEFTKTVTTNSNGFNDDKHHEYECHHFCGSYCCSVAEFTEFAKTLTTNSNGFNDDKHHGYECHHFCGNMCCTAAEYAEFRRATAGKPLGN